MLRDFSRELSPRTFRKFPYVRTHLSVCIHRISLMDLPTSLYQDNQPPGVRYFLRPPIATELSTGILTRFPSTTLLSLALGADSPCSDEHRTGNLRFSACGFFTRILVTHVSILTSDISSNPCRVTFINLQNAPLPLDVTIQSAASVDSFSPVTSSVQNDSTSELLRFL